MTASATTPARHRRRRILVTALIFILAVFLLPLISLGHYHSTIAASLSRSLGHNVNIGSINLTLFPLPGLEIHDLTVDEDPAFGAEPLLIAPTVTVYPRLSTLWTLRLEVGRIDLDNASVNLVRDSAGRWNFSSLLLQASRSRAAPTAQHHTSAALRFPYVDFSGARINFKEGYEKKPFSLFNTDASLWLSDSNHWRIRLEAQPVRTDLDLDLEDTGTLRLDGSLTRAPSLEQLPLDLQVSWTGAQLGQVSRLLFGFDSGWRGALRLEADITGDMENLKIHPRLHIINAHRLEFTPLNELDIDAFCDAIYHRPAHSLDHLVCLLPTGSGHLLLTGSVPELSHPHPDLNLEINHMPASFVVSILGMLRRTLPTDLSASGDINGTFTWTPPSSPARKSAPLASLSTRGNETARSVLTGHALADNVSIHLANVDQAFTFPSLIFATPNWTPPSPSHKRERVPHISRLKRENQPPSSDIILLRPATFSAGAPIPMHVSAQLSRAGFSLRFTGDASLARLQPVTGDFSQLGPLQSLAPRGSAESDLTLSGPWLLPVTLEPGPASQSQLRGFVRLQHAQLSPGWLPQPINIASATVQFGSQPAAHPVAQPGRPAPESTASAKPNTIIWANATISVNGITAKGSVSYPAECGNPSGCPAEVNLDFPSLDAAALQTAIFGSNPGAFLQSLLSTVESAPPAWPPIVGTIHVATFTIGDLRLTNARAAIAVRSGKLNIASLDAATLGGFAHATGSVQSTSNGPAYTLNLTWTGIKLPQAAALFHEKWGTGAIDGQSTLRLNGFSSLPASATGTFGWVINGPWLGTPSAAPSAPKSAAHVQQLPPLRLPLIRLYPQLTHWPASGIIANQSISFTKGPATGTISFSRQLHLTWQPASPKDRHAKTPPVTFTGTLAHPLIAVHAAGPVPARTP
ncbi:MAG TPA: AsmA family protein [Acidobacteriaceae bacterium]|nr:AsmA family protein [Acidobacteriaceae bacterium]